MEDIDVTFLLEDEVKQQTTKKEKRFELAEAMLNAKQFAKLRDDYKKIKQLSVDLSLHLQEIDCKMKKDMVTDDKLRVHIELLEQEIKEETRHQNQSIVEKLMPKIKKRIKLKHIQDKFRDKVSLQEFRQAVSSLNDKIAVMSDKVELKLPAIEYNFNQKLKNTVEK